MRNAMDAQEVAVGWWPGDARHGQAAFYAYAHPAVAGFDARRPGPGRHALGQCPGRVCVAWDDVRSAADPRAAGVEFARSAFRHAVTSAGGTRPWPRPRTVTRRRSGDGAVTLSSPLPELRGLMRRAASLRVEA